MNDYHRWLDLVLLSLLIFLPSRCDAQTYQGPSGGRGGYNFDFWAESEKKINIKEITVSSDDVIRCIGVVYPDHSADGVTEIKHGGCYSRNYFHEHFRLAPDEFIIGIAGRYGD